MNKSTCPSHVDSYDIRHSSPPRTDKTKTANDVDSYDIRHSSYTRAEIQELRSYPTPLIVYKPKANNASPAHHVAPHPQQISLPPSLTNTYLAKTQRPHSRHAPSTTYYAKKTNIPPDNGTQSHQQTPTRPTDSAVTIGTKPDQLITPDNITQQERDRQHD